MLPCFIKQISQPKGVATANPKIFQPLSQLNRGFPAPSPTTFGQARLVVGRDVSRRSGNEDKRASESSAVDKAKKTKN
ncbi:hypothetical protein R6Q59_035726 [Mikania micrantha]